MKLELKVTNGDKTRVFGFPKQGGAPEGRPVAAILSVATINDKTGEVGWDVVRVDPGSATSNHNNPNVAIQAAVGVLGCFEMTPAMPVELQAQARKLAAALGAISSMVLPMVMEDGEMNDDLFDVTNMNRFFFNAEGAPTRPMSEAVAAVTAVTTKPAELAKVLDDLSARYEAAPDYVDRDTFKAIQEAIKRMGGAPSDPEAN